MTAATCTGRRPIATVLCAGVIALATAFISGPGPAFASARPDASSQPPGPRIAAASGEELLTVSASSAGSAWATGQSLQGGGSFLLHWNGKAWSRVSLPAADTATGVTDISLDNAWLAGSRSSKTLIMHWNGTRWSRVSSPDVAGQANYTGPISASSPRNAWAAGDSCPPDSQGCVPLMLHWNGKAWSEVASPAIGDSAVRSVKTLSGNDAWAVGHDCATGGCYEPLVLHWNGTGWSQVSLPSTGPGGLSGVTATSAGNAWAVGAGMHTFTSWIFRWNGTTWSTVAHPSPGVGDFLAEVTATSARNAWAVGYSCTARNCGRTATLILHWNGKTWSRVSSPNSGDGSELADVTATSFRNAWAVGSDCTVEIKCSPIILHWNGKAWSKD